MLRANHPEDRSSRILAARYWAQLLGAFSACFSKEGEIGDLGRPAGAASATTERAFDRSASAFLGLPIQKVGELTGERIDECADRVHLRAIPSEGQSFKRKGPNTLGELKEAQVQLT